MGIGRRNFLRLTGLALAGLAIDPLQSVIVNNNVYINKKLGIMFYKPSAWGFINIKDFGKLKDEQILGNGWNDQKESVWEEIGDPICIITKYYEDKAENHGVFSPTMTLNVTHKSELSDLGYESFEELMQMSAYGAARLLQDFQIKQKFQPYLVSGCKFYEYDAEYMFEHADLKEPLKVELNVVKAEHNDFYYDFNFHQSSAQHQIAYSEFSDIKRSIQLI